MLDGPVLAYQVRDCTFTISNPAANLDIVVHKDLLQSDVQRLLSGLGKDVNRELRRVPFPEGLIANYI